MQEKLFDVLRAPLVTEKTARANQVNQYVFRVATTADKAQIKAAVEKLFGVSVKAVQVLNVNGKTRRFRGVPGRRADWKKAYVTLAEGQVIDLGQAG
ncbi:MAG: 50S ribosomal protein L23 [Halothiobacillus sp.]|uniref:50S ribosomal protein L23 n=1 Tax=Halothiobacillus sp. TaxID=1891311 RepID=UPI002AD5AA23|nr:50S ribosomal protein L23 [Halothiobacillus sp.]MDA3877098.1 50S ribosomal protein L23 [Halothiobacillus sp.]